MIFAPSNPDMAGNNPLPTASPESVGMSSERLARIGTALKAAYGSGSGEPADKITGLDQIVKDAVELKFTAARFEQS